MSKVGALQKLKKVFDHMCWLCTVHHWSKGERAIIQVIEGTGPIGAKPFKKEKKKVSVGFEAMPSGS